MDRGSQARTDDRECRAAVVSDLEQFKLAELSVRVFASPETLTALGDDIVALLETKYDRTAWEVDLPEDVTDDPDHREALERLRQEAEVDTRLR